MTRNKFVTYIFFCFGLKCIVHFIFIQFNCIVLLFKAYIIFIRNRNKHYTVSILCLYAITAL